MAAPAPIYDLMVLLDTTAPEEQRAKVLAEAEAMIKSGGPVVAADSGPRTWRTRSATRRTRSTA